MSLIKVKDALQLRHDEQEMAYRQLIDQHEATQHQARERTRWDRLRNDLLQRKAERDDLTAHLERLLRQREMLLCDLSDLRDHRFAIRREIAERITAALDQAVRVSVSQSGDTEAYQQALHEALRHANIVHGQVSQRLAATCRPAQLVAAVRAGDPKPLMEIADLNANQAQKVVEILAEPSILFELEVVEQKDQPRIELKIGDEYKPSQSLSTGQKCTTILPILLLESDNPLLIDQPEDNLDNRFIFECVVNSIRQTKARRQLIFVTHNPNIPVLGDADRVFVLEADGNSTRLAAVGGVDECKHHIVTLLEGGEAAFKQRKHRYNY